RVLFFIGVACHFTLISGYNIRFVAKGLSAVYGFMALPEPVIRQLSCVLDGQGIVRYGVLTGIRMGYGFYAPQVGSPYTLALEASTSNGARDTLFTPGLQTAAGVMRFALLLDFFQYMERDDPGQDVSDI